ncbi:protein ROOT HAIR DEFECTIVE 3-like, partial [Dendrobium catenatum]|uniref:protein ROOT HAIR DEFECTIVE 3-like n=1 Tax=Dendrobium catenatum TaxID=906689 RepID=UPI0010A07147
MTTLVGFTSTISSFGTDQTTIETFVAKLKRHAIKIVESKEREEAEKVLINMKDRFEIVFSYDSDSMPRLWIGKEDIKTITKMARLASLKLLVVLVVICLEENTDNVEDLLQLTLMDGLISSTSNRNLLSDTLIALNSNKWGDERLHSLF